MTIDYYDTEGERKAIVGFGVVLIYHLIHSYTFIVGLGLKDLLIIKKDEIEPPSSLNITYSRSQGHPDLSYCSGNGPNAIFPRLSQSIPAFQPITMSDLSSSSSSFVLARFSHSAPSLHRSHSLSLSLSPVPGSRFN